MLSVEISSNKTRKVYLARVKGRFPRLLHKLNVLSQESLYAAMKDTGDSKGKTIPTDDLSHVPVNTESATPHLTKKRAREEDVEFVQGAEIEDTVSSISADYDAQYNLSIDDGVYSNSDVGYGISANGDILLRCAIGVVSQRDGVYANDPVSGKSALTAFKILGYRASDDTSLLECKPLTGR